MGPLVSILVSSYNAGEFLRASVLSVLRQTYANLEILLVDDGSTDGSIDAIADLADRRLHIVRQANAGKSAALNRALGLARGEFYAIHDADDVSHPRRVERQVAHLKLQPELAAVFCGHDLILNGRHLAPRCRAKDATQCAQDVESFRMPAHDPTVMYRMSFVRDMRYEETLRIGQGYDYILRVGERHRMAVLGECLYSYRIYFTSVTRQNAQRRHAFALEVLQRACARRGLEFHKCFPPRRGKNATRDNNLASQFIESALDQRACGRRLAAVRTGIHCAMMHPLDPHYHKALIYAVAPAWAVRRLRRRSGLLAV